MERTLKEVREELDYKKKKRKEIENEFDELVFKRAKGIDLTKEEIERMKVLSNKLTEIQDEIFSLMKESKELMNW